MEVEKKSEDLLVNEAAKTADTAEKKVEVEEKAAAEIKAEEKADTKADNGAAEEKKSGRKPRKTKTAKTSKTSKTKDAAKAAVSRAKAGLKAAKEDAKRSRAARKAVKSEVHLQFSGKSYATEDLVKIARDVWQYDLGKDPADFASVELYVKPAENLTYYVINDNVTGSFFI